jgi:hypothetical protein
MPAAMQSGVILIASCYRTQQLKHSRHCHHWHTTSTTNPTAATTTTTTTNNKNNNSVALVRVRTILTERPPPVGEVSANFCG